MARRQALSRSGKSAAVANGRAQSMAAPTRPTRNEAKPAVQTSSANGSANGNSARAAALARRKALSTSGKSALAQTDRTRRSTHRLNGVAANGAANGQTALQTAAAPAPVAAAPAAAAEAAPASQVTSQASRRFVRPPVIKANSTREIALARRKALSSRGKVATKTADRVRDAKTCRRSAAVQAGANTTANPANAETAAAKSAPSASQPTRAAARTKGGLGKVSRVVPRTKPVMAPGRAASLARRRAQASRGKAGLSAAGISPAQAVRTSNPEMSGRELARALRAQRSQNGNAGKKKCAPSGRQRRNCLTGESAVRAAQDQPWKVGASETTHGQTVTGTQVGRKASVTGDEASTCRIITGTEYMGADIFREFCQTDPTPSVMRGGVSATSVGNAVTGNRVGRSPKVTGDEPGTCKRVTGTEYVGAEQTQSYCGITPEPHPAKVARGQTPKNKPVTGNLVLRSERVTGNEAGFNRQLTGTPYTQLGEGGAPPKVQKSMTLQGHVVTGTYVGRRERMTGDEMGSCRTITGDEYIGLEQYQSFCNTRPEPSDQKVGRSSTITGETITGTMTGRSPKVTGDEPGVCKAITGTPYAGLEQYSQFCEVPQTNMAMARMYASKRAAGAPMTGIQPGIGGVVTGTERGACETVSGTPYLGDDQQAAVCKRPMGARNGRAVNGSAGNGAAQSRPSRQSSPAVMNGQAAANGAAINGAAMNGAAQGNGLMAANGQAMANGQAVNGQMAQMTQMTMDGQAAVVTNGMANGSGMNGAAMNGAAAMAPINGSMNGSMNGVPLNGAALNGGANGANGQYEQFTTQAANGANGIASNGHLPWEDFSTKPPMHASAMLRNNGRVTGNRYENGHITGPFGMAAGKVTGTEEARFGRPPAPAVENPQPTEIDGRVKARITGEGQDAGLKITGDDWELSNRVTGTEGRWAEVRNPTRRGGPMSAMAMLRKGPRNEDLPPPVNKVTGSSGNTDAGALVTYSGGARG